MSGRTLAIGDIHGCDFALTVLLGAVSPTSADTVVVLGDVVDRGGGSKQAIDLLLQLRQATNLVFIRGNHEEMMMQSPADRNCREAWLKFGGLNTLFSYGGGLESVPPDHWEFLNSAVDFFETPEAVFIHANLEPGVALEQQRPQWLRWTHLSGQELPLSSGKLVVCGHTPQKSGLPLVRPGWICLDTFACGSGWLTCFDIASGVAYQANEKRQSRQLTLEEIAAESVKLAATTP